MAVIVGIAVAATLLVVMFKPMFGDFDGFMECVRFWLTPDVVSLFRGEYSEDWMSEMKLFLYLGGSVGLGYAAHAAVSAMLS